MHPMGSVKLPSKEDTQETHRMVNAVAFGLGRPPPPPEICTWGCSRPQMNACFVLGWSLALEPGALFLSRRIAIQFPAEVDWRKGSIGTAGKAHKPHPFRLNAPCTPGGGGGFVGCGVQGVRASWLRRPDAVVVAFAFAGFCVFSVATIPITHYLVVALSGWTMNL